MRAILASSCLLGLLAGCGPGLLVAGNGTMTSEGREVNGTKSVHLSVPGSLVVTLGSPASLRIDAEENLLAYLESRVVLGELQLDVRPNVSLRTTQSIRFELTVPSLQGLSISVPGSITAPALTAADFSLSSSSAGSIHLAGLEASTLATRISSSGSITVESGAVVSQDVRISSSGSFVASGMQSARANVEISSSGSAFLWVTERLDAVLSSSGNVRYVGSPQVFAHLSSAGTVRPLSN